MLLSKLQQEDEEIAENLETVMLAWEDFFNSQLFLCLLHSLTSSRFLPDIWCVNMNN